MTDQTGKATGRCTMPKKRRRGVEWTTGTAAYWKCNHRAKTDRPTDRSTEKKRERERGVMTFPSEEDGRARARAERLQERNDRGWIRSGCSVEIERTKAAALPAGVQSKNETKREREALDSSRSFFIARILEILNRGHLIGPTLKMRLVLDSCIFE